MSDRQYLPGNCQDRIYFKTARTLVPRAFSPISLSLVKRAAVICSLVNWTSFPP